MIKRISSSPGPKPLVLKPLRPNPNPVQPISKLKLAPRGLGLTLKSLQSTTVLKPYLGLDLINPQFSSIHFSTASALHIDVRRTPMFNASYQNAPQTWRSSIARWFVLCCGLIKIYISASIEEGQTHNL